VRPTVGVERRGRGRGGETTRLARTTIALVLLLPAHLPAQEPPLELRLSLKGAALVQRERTVAPGAEPNGAAGLWRLRADATVRSAEWIAAAVAYEHRLRVDAGSAVAAGLFPSAAPGPFRLRQLDWPLARGQGFAWRHELDRAAVVLRGGPATFTAGRQAIGWGKGVLFGALDLFAPFAPLEVDREWRRGVDAARLEIRLPRRMAAELVAAGAERAGEAAVTGRLRGAAGDADAELVAGWRAGDWLAGMAASGALAGAELHGELLALRAREPLAAGGAFARGRGALKAVAGASRRLALGQGLYLLAEYQWSGLGAARPADLPALLQQPSFRDRLLRGDMQLTGRQAAAAMASYEASEVLTCSLTALVSTRDGSGVVAPTVKLDLGDKLTVTASLYLPWGARPEGAVPRSDLGGTPVAGMVQVAIYE